MDACLSFIMANHGRVKPNDIVYDPFVGTGMFLSTGGKNWGIVLLWCYATLLPDTVASDAELTFEIVPKAKWGS